MCVIFLVVSDIVILQVINTWPVKDNKGDVGSVISTEQTLVHGPKKSTGVWFNFGKSFSAHSDNLHPV